MQRFRFALEGVLRYRQMQCDVQRARVEELYAALEGVEAQKTRLERELAAEQRGVKLQGVVEPLELLALDSFSRSAGQEQNKLSARRSELLATLEQQKGTLLEAEGNCDLLERVRGRQQTAWKSAEAAELEALANEAFLSRWNFREAGETR